MTLVSGEGAKYSGETTDSGTRHGRGEYVWLNGDRYQVVEFKLIVKLNLKFDEWLLYTPFNHW